jgi:hypothetical protein
MSCAHAFGEYCPECITGLVADYNRARVRVQELENELNTVRKQTHTSMRDEIDATWAAIENGFNIEPRAYFEQEAPRNGFRFALVQAVHHLWKRDAKVQDLEREVARLKKLLDRIYKWDMMDTTPDGNYWRGEIDKVIVP